MANTIIEVPVDLKLQLSRQISTLIFTQIHLVYLIIHFLCDELKKKKKKKTVSHNFFKYLFSTGTATTKN